MQDGYDLGERMHNAFQNSITDENSKTILIGSDCLQLNTWHIKSACEALNNNDVVFGPAKDGGYYLIALKKPVKELLIGRNWSHGQVLKDALKTISDLGLKVHLLEELSDIDTYEDWLSFKHLIES